MIARLALPALAVPLAPLLAAQALWVRRTTPRLPEAAGPATGSTAGGTCPCHAPASPPIRLAVLGESTAAGVGVGTHDEGLAGHLAADLARRTGRPVTWQVAARSGATARRVVADLVGGLAPADLAVVALGVNDLLELTRLRAFERDLTELLTLVPAEHVLVSAMAPVGRFPALPRPLRTVMGLRARALDEVIARVAGERYAPAELPVEAEGFFAADGFHPSARGYQAWAAALLSKPGLPIYGSTY